MIWPFAMPPTESGNNRQETGGRKQGDRIPELEFRLSLLNNHQTRLADAIDWNAIKSESSVFKTTTPKDVYKLVILTNIP